MGFLEIFKEGNGTWSSIRFCMILVVLTITAVWAIISLHTMKMAVIEQSVIEFAGIVVLGKTVQKWKEPSKPATPTAPDVGGTP